MRILVDATPLLLRSAGVKTYTYHWLQHLLEQAGNEQILTFPHIGKLGALNHERSMLGPARTFSHLAVLMGNVSPLLSWGMAQRGRVPCLHADPQSSAEDQANRHDSRHDLPPDAGAAHSRQSESRRELHQEYSAPGGALDCRV